MISGKFCPVCKNINDRDATACRHCGASLEQFTGDGAATTRNADVQGKDTDRLEDLLVDESLVPLGGIAVYIVGTTSPVFLSTDNQFVIGRKMEATSEPFLDLSNLGGYLLGLSRRHALIRRTDCGYEVVDLASTNGTWLNGERLSPRRPYPMNSGSRLRMGRMRFFVLFRSPAREN